VLVYRDAHRNARGSDLVHALVDAWRRGSSLEASLRAAELECALADLGHPHAETCARLSDAFASAWLGGGSPSPERVRGWLDELAPPAEFALRIPEGYAYYALQPEAYAVLAAELPGRAPVAVVGVRSIGTSLSAVVAAACRRAGRPAERLTVRPTGHPFARQLVPSDAERAWIAARRAEGAAFVVVDEGPGMSGSTFLAVAEALEAAGVPRARIRLFCSHRPDPARLVGPAAASRWSRFSAHAVAPLQPPAGARDLSGGQWRALAYPDAQRWPAVWASRERVRWLSADGRWIDKFEGLAPYGDAAFGRARQLAEAGIAPPCTRIDRGFVRYARVHGRPARAPDFALDELARYCALRAEAFACPTSADAGALATMVHVNVAEALGIEVHIAPEVRRTIIADARMDPHEWLVTPRGLVKTDGHGHGDDHFYPGPTDVAWDVAGTIVEWRLRPALAQRFVARVEALVGEAIAPRLEPFVVAYTAFRLGAVTFALQEAAGAEAARLRRVDRYYRARLRAALRDAVAAGSVRCDTLPP